MRKLVCLLMLCCLCGNIYAQYDISDADGVLSPKETTALRQIIAHQLVFYNRVFPDVSIKPVDVRLNIFSNYGLYILYQNELMETIRHRSMGFYSHKNREAVVCKKDNDQGFLKICYHELSHFFVNTYFRAIPTWLNEGLAVYFEHMKPGKTVNHQVMKTFIFRVQTMIDIRDIDLADFILWNSKKFYDKSFSHENYGYALGYAIVLYLMQKDENMVVALIRELNAGKKGSDAVDAVYDGGFSAFEEDFMKYVSKYS